MEKKITKDLSLGECVILYPAIVDKFNEIELDYCCGGKENLEAALKDKNVDVDKFIKEVNEDFEKFKFDNTVYVNWEERSSEELIDHIVNTHHAKTFELLKEIDPLMVKIFKVHFYHMPDGLKKIHKLFGELKCELEEHLIKEEKVLFPQMLEYDRTENEDEKLLIEKEIKSFISEHEAAGDILKELAEITDDYTAPEWACPTFRLVYAKMHELEKDLFVHIHKENNILFKRF